jgi:hypothetical protein
MEKQTRQQGGTAGVHVLFTCWSPPRGEAKVTAEVEPRPSAIQAKGNSAWSTLMPCTEIIRKL